MAVLTDEPSSILAVVTALVIVHITSKAVYNIFFHPLRSYPGPLSHAAFRLPYCYRLLRGKLAFDMLSLHKEYGDVVRVAPNELAFSHPAAWKDIMGHQTGGGGEEMAKFTNFYRPVPQSPTSIVSADRDEHSVLRRQFSHGFSERAMRAQEPVIAGYIDLLIQRLHEKCGNGAEALNMTGWYNFTTFDIIGDLAFGRPFGCLENSEYHPFIPLLFKATKMGTVLFTLSFYPLRDRIKLEGERDDLIEGLLRKKDEMEMDMDKIESNANILLIGGSETTATLLSGVTYLLLMNSDALARLTEEVRGAFDSEDEIDIQSVSKLTYMLACLNEALRMYPPVPIGLPRVVPKNGGQIAGNYVEEGTVVAVHHWASYHNEKYFTDPFNFRPERFLGDVRFAEDRLEMLQPFHVGPRNCLGRNLAYTEMRLILARVIFNFDMKIARDSTDWIERQGVWFLWSKPSLNVYLAPATR
ncbi:cytochrome P450 monooxygenase [Aspergillus ambiguus]|uniref:cytochrome P450 n=1 Tax=Aspergillus ambiguus TaxID=176160 RepID=UPI003CCCC5A3